ncbi:X8 domain [Dillenia turbinata]|uniref:X8 domain n=1 Tax=Dillenia turbinata TaxID=194707 RepID=A0AAN8UXD9_9MAGN
MAKIALPLSIFFSVLWFLLLNSGLWEFQKTWCIAKHSSSDAVLQGNIDHVCKKLKDKCAIIKPGQPCHEPNTLINHASVTMNLYYQAKGQKPKNCNFKNSGLVSISDPSYEGCKYA